MFLRSWRRANLMSAQMLSTSGHIQTSRLRCSISVALPKARRAAWTASVARHSVGDERFDLFLEMLLHLLGKIGEHSVRGKHASEVVHAGFLNSGRTENLPTSQTRDVGYPDFHSSRSPRRQTYTSEFSGTLGARTSEMPSSICSKRETSRSRCLAPSGVML